MAHKRGRKTGDGLGRFGGRTKGTPNRDTQELIKKAEELGVSPFEVMLHFASRNWKALKFKSPTKKVATASGLVEVDVITPELQLRGAEGAAKYIYAVRKAVEVTGEGGGAVKTENEGASEIVEMLVKVIAGSKERK
jgi:hypothetical protein